MTKSAEPRLENKAAALPAGENIETMFSEFMSAFEEFKSTNDTRLAELEQRGSADTLLEGKLERLNSILDGHKSTLDRAALDKARPALEGGRVREGDEYKDAFSAYVKRGEEKALSVGSNEDGGYLVPAETETEISRLLTEVSPMRAICGVLQALVGVTRDGFVGPITLEAVAKRDPRALITALCDQRMNFLQRLSTWGAFGRGWTNRVADIRQMALADADDFPSQTQGANEMSVLDGYKTYVVGALMLIVGLALTAGLELPNFADYSGPQLVMEALAVIFLRRGIKSEVGKV